MWDSASPFLSLPEIGPAGIPSSVEVGALSRTPKGQTRKGWPSPPSWKSMFLMDSARGGLPPFSQVPGGPGQLPFGCAGVLRVDRVRRGGVDLRELRKP